MNLYADTDSLPLDDPTIDNYLMSKYRLVLYIFYRKNQSFVV